MERKPPEPPEPIPAHADPRTYIPRASTADTDNPCKHHTHGDTCGICGYGIGFDSTDFEGYCD